MVPEQVDEVLAAVAELARELRDRDPASALPDAIEGPVDAGGVDGSAEDAPCEQGLDEPDIAPSSQLRFVTCAGPSVTS
jgi:hypothetical protein